MFVCVCVCVCVCVLLSPHRNWTHVDKPLPTSASAYIRCQLDGLAHFCAQEFGLQTVTHLFCFPGGTGVGDFVSTCQHPNKLSVSVAHVAQHTEPSVGGHFAQLFWVDSKIRTVTESTFAQLFWAQPLSQLSGSHSFSFSTIDSHTVIDSTVTELFIATWCVCANTFVVIVCAVERERESNFVSKSFRTFRTLKTKRSLYSSE